MRELALSLVNVYKKTMKQQQTCFIIISTMKISDKKSLINLLKFCEKYQNYINIKTFEMLTMCKEYSHTVLKVWEILN